jgi:hypothetical protein
MYYVLLFASLLWMLVGIFPLVCYEADSREVILGCDILYSEGWTFPPVSSYEYNMQPLATVMVVALKHLLPFLTCEQVYCLATATTGFALLAGCVEFVHRVTGLGKVTALLAAMLLPEMYAITMYPNTAVFSATCFVYALLLLYHGRYVPAGVLMCLAPLFRLDVLTVYPVILPLLLFRGKPMARSTALSTAYAVAVVAADLLLLWLLKADVMSVLNHYSGWNETIATLRVVIAVFGYYSLVYLVLVPLGLYLYIRKREWRELLLVLLPMVLLHATFARMGCASKHYLYISPFVMMLGSRCLSWMKDVASNSESPAGASCMKWALASLAGLLLLSVRVFPGSKPWSEADTGYTAGMAVPVCSTSLPSLKVAFGIGAGQRIPTYDEQMLASGHLFYSWYMHEYKASLKRQFDTTTEILCQPAKAEVAALGWGTWTPLACRLLSEGYRLEGYRKASGYAEMTLKGNGREMVVQRYLLAEDDEERFLHLVGEQASKPHSRDAYILLLHSPRFSYYMAHRVSNRNVTRLTDMLYGIDGKTDTR